MRHLPHWLHSILHTTFAALTYSMALHHCGYTGCAKAVRVAVHAVAGYFTASSMLMHIASSQGHCKECIEARTALQHSNAAQILKSFDRECSKKVRPIQWSGQTQMAVVHKIEGCIIVLLMAHVCFESLCCSQVQSPGVPGTCTYDH